MEFRLTSLKETKRLANALAKFIKETKVCSLVYLNGDLGAGKTTFAQFFFESLGVQNTTSPTYSIMNVYTKEGETFYHADVYRAEDVEGLVEEAALEEIMESGSIVLIEWTKKFPHFFDRFTHIGIDIAFSEKNERHLFIDFPLDLKKNSAEALFDCFLQQLLKE